MTHPLTHDRLCQLLSYEPEAGVFRWTSFCGKRSGKVAGYYDRANGYWRISIDGHDIKASRLAWFYVKGDWPPAIIDHRNLNKSDDRWENLRLADHTLNGANKLLRKDSKSGIKGVRKVGRRWKSSIRSYGKYFHLGYFSTPEAAHEAYAAAARALFGEYARP